MTETNETITVPDDIERPVTPLNYGYNSIEAKGTRQLRVNSKGITGSWTAKKFPFEWVENGVPTELGTRVPILGNLLPAYGSSWSPEYLFCRLADITYVELDNGYCEATLNYTSEGFTRELEVSMQHGYETYKVPAQAKWGVNTPSASALNPYIAEQDFGNPYMMYSINYKTAFLPNQQYTIINYLNLSKTAMSALKKVNNDIWHTFPAESMLCESINITPEFDIAGWLIAITFKADFKIYNDFHSHNLQWKEPVPLPNGKGVEYVWHDIPSSNYPESAFYTTDPYKKGVKVYTDDVTITNNNDGTITVTPITPAPFHGGWYKPYMVYQGEVIYIHGTCNFTTVLGIPNVVQPEPESEPISPQGEGGDDTDE